MSTVEPMGDEEFAILVAAVEAGDSTYAFGERRCSTYVSRRLLARMAAMKTDPGPVDAVSAFLKLRDEEVYDPDERTDEERDESAKAILEIPSAPSATDRAVVKADWRGIDTALHDGSLVLLGKKDDPDWPLRCRRWQDGRWRGHDGDDATHWMPLTDILSALSAAPAPALVPDPTAEGEAVAWVYTVRGDSVPLRRITRTPTGVTGDITEVRALVFAHPPTTEAFIERAEVARVRALIDYERAERTKDAVEFYALTEERDRMRQALEPFARANEFFQYGADDSDVCARQAGSGRHYTDMFKLSDFRRAAEALRSVGEGADAALAKIVEDERVRLAQMIEEMLAEKVFSDSAPCRMALAIAANNVRRGRRLTSREKFDNLTAAIEEDDPALADRLREMTTPLTSTKDARNAG